MARALKITLLSVLAIVLLLMTAVFAITTFIDPNDFKPQITQAARDQANLDVAIPGELSWSFWPYLGINIGRTEVRLADQQELFAGFDQVVTSVAVLPLLRGAVTLSGVHLAGLELNLQETADGANWERIGTDGAATPDDTASTDSGGLSIPLTIPLVTVENGRVRYVNSMDGSDIRVDQLNLTAEDVSLTEAFVFALSLRYQDQDDIRVDLALSGNLGMDLDSNRFRLTPLVADTTVAGLTALPVTLHSRLTIDAALDDDTVDITDLLLEAAGTRTTGKLSIAQLSGKPILAGTLETAPFSANEALKLIGEAPIATADGEALTRISARMTLAGPENSILLKPLAITIDDSTLSGEAGISDLDSGHIYFDLALDSITVDGYLPPTEAEQQTADKSDADMPSTEAILPPLSSEELLPLADIRALSMDGIINIAAMQYDAIKATNMAFTVQAENGLIELKRASGDVLDGKFTATASLDARTDTPLITLRNELAGMQVQPLAQMALEDDLFSGILDMTVNFSARGNSEQALAESGTGKLDMQLAKGTLHGVSLHNTLIGGLNDMLGQFQVLTRFIPAAESGKLPRELNENTEIVQLTAQARLDDLVAYVDKLDATLDKGMLSGNGEVNLRSEAFDFTLGLRSAEISNDRYLRDQIWPLRCRGNLAGSPAKWCKPDSKQFAAIGKKIAGQIAKDKIADELGVEARGDTTQEVIKNAVEDKAKDEVKKQVQDGLKKLFGR
mgnify:CR=1 FL=1